MTKDEKQSILRERVDVLGIACTDAAVDKLLRYQELLQDWNTRMNLTGDASFDALLDKHLIDSLAPLTVEGLLPQNASIIDVGSGAGLPGIPLAIVRPDLRFTLLDSLQKRVGFLHTIVEKLELANVSAVHARAEDAARDVEFREHFTVAIARAVAALPVLEELLLPFVRIGGKSICYKGPSVEEELPAGKTAAEILGGGQPAVKAVSIPHLPEWKHCLVICEKRKHTPVRYPRKAGIPFKNPLGMKKETET